MLSDLNDICKNGANLEDRGWGATVAGFAFNSLNIALKSYFKTYRDMKYGLHLFDGHHDPGTIDINTPLSFFENSAETILHLHHFTELIIKDLLRTVHPLMADTAATKPVILKKLLFNEPIGDLDDIYLQSIEYREALERLVELIKAREITDVDKLQFIVESKNVLEKLNNLRNRIWHRGRFILRYDALDKFMCHFIPTLNHILELDRYKQCSAGWKYKPLKCGFDPFNFLLTNVNSYDVEMFAFAKELGRAAYNNPLHVGVKFSKMFDDEVIDRAQAAATAERFGARSIQACPVCGVESLVIYDEIETSGEDMETGRYERAWRYTWQVNCFCCDFEINHHLKNGTDYGIPVPDYWTSEEM